MTKAQLTKQRPAASGIIAGFNKGHQTTPRAYQLNRHHRLGLPHKKLVAVKALISDLVGPSPLEKRVLEMLRYGKDKRALKLCKKRLGSITAAKKKRGKMEALMRRRK